MGKGQQKHGPAPSKKGSTGGGGPARPPGRSNSDMQARLPTPEPTGVDAGAQVLFDDFARFQAEYGSLFGRASGMVNKAHAAQDAGDVPGYRDTVGAMVDPGDDVLSSLDWFLPGYGITEQLSYLIDDKPEQVNVPEFVQGVQRVASFAETVKSQRSLLVPFLVPRTVHGRAIPAIPGLPLGELSFTDAVEGQAQAVEPLLGAAEEIRAILAGGADAKGPAAASLATEIVGGALGEYEPGSGEHEYLYLVITQSNASAELKGRVDWLLGRDDFAQYEGLWGVMDYAQGMGGMVRDLFAAPSPAAATSGAGGAGGPAGATQGAATDTEAPKTYGNTTPAGADGAVATRAAGKTAGTRDFDTSKLPEKEETEDEKKRREKEEGTVKGYAGNRGRQRVEVAHERDGKMTVGDGKVGGEASGKRKVTRRDGSSNEVGVQGGLDAGSTLSGSGTVSAARKTKDGGNLSGSATAGRDEEGHFTGNARIQGGYEDKKGNGTTYGKSVGYTEKGGASMTTDVAVKRKRDDGSTATTTGGISVSTKGNASISGGRVVEDTKGNKRGTSGSIAYDNESGAFSVQAKRTNADKEGNDTGSWNGGATVDVDGKDGKTGVKGNIGYSKGGKTIAASGGYQVTVKPPEKEGKRWVVTWETDLSGSVSGGVEGKKGGASGKIGGGKKTSGRRSFASEDEAKAFFEHPKLDGMPADAHEVADMAEGDTRGTESSFEVGGDGSLKIGMAEVGAGGSHSSSDYTTLTKGKGGKVRVEIGSRELDEVHGSIGMAGVSGGAGRSWASQSSVTVEFDLDTPEGRLAYAHHERFHALPRGARGWRIVGSAKADAQTDSYTLGILGVKVGSSHTVSHGVEYDEGNKLERDSGTDASSVSVPLLGSYERSHRLSMLQVNDGRSFYNTESTVKGSSLGDVRSGLAKSAMEGEEGSGGSNKGTYRLQSAISEADMDRFIDIATSPDAKAQFLFNGGLHADDGLGDLQSGLRKAAGDRDAQRRVLAHWVADNGYDALTTLHALTHGKVDMNGEGGTQMYVAIDGDPYMDGMKGQLDLELRIQAWDERLNKGERGPSLATEVRKDIVFQREKAKHLEECSELPNRIYMQEFDRVRGNVAILESLLQRALVDDGEASASADSLDSPKFVAFRRASANLSVARSECEAKWAEAYQHYAYAEKGAGRSNDDRLTESLPDLADVIDRARDLYQRGENARQGAQLAETLSGQDLNERTVAPLTALVLKARAEYLRSKRFFTGSVDAYFEISTKSIGRGPYNNAAGYRMVPHK